MARHRKKSRRPAHRSKGAFNSKLMLAAICVLVAGIVVYAYRFHESGKHPAVTEQAEPGSAESLMQVEMPDNIASEMVDYEGFRLSFNPEMHLPNYVAWEITADEVNASEVSRNDSKFRVDYRVDGCATPEDYRRSGFDRGHMAPAADMKWSRTAMDDCHLMTNIAPQTHQLNGGPWQTVEKNCRKWAQRDSAIIVICGPVLTDRLTATIGQTPVPVPERFFKVVLAPYANPPRGIAFIMSNYDVSGGAQQTAVSIDQVEAVTGFDFFSALPDDIENQVESQSNYQQWQRLKQR